MSTSYTAQPVYPLRIPPTTTAIFISVVLPDYSWKTILQYDRPHQLRLCLSRQNQGPGRRRLAGRISGAPQNKLHPARYRVAAFHQTMTKLKLGGLVPGPRLTNSSPETAMARGTSAHSGTVTAYLRVRRVRMHNRRRLTSTRLLCAKKIQS